MARSGKSLGKNISFEQAVCLFKEWGFIVEPGPGAGEVSLIIDAPDHKTYCVYEAHLLPEIAATILAVRGRCHGLYQASDLSGKPDYPM
ncbi:MAG: hypothetical protein P8Z00_09635 [Anaerolineales bacterium]|jgi:hypothetical protein